MTAIGPPTDPPSHAKSAGTVTIEGTVVWLRGEHDVSTVAELSRTMAEAIATDDVVVVDLSGVEFMDATTVGVLAAADDYLEVRSRSMVLRAPSRCARRVLEASGLAGLLDRYPPAAALEPAAAWEPAAGHFRR